MNKFMIIGVAAVVVAGGAFYAGSKYGGRGGLSARIGARGGFQQGQGAGAPGGRQFAAGPMGGAVTGEVLSKDDKSITVKLRDGGSKIVFISASTVITKSATGSIADLAVGAQVFVGGSSNDDGSVTAQTVQLRPDMPRPTSSPKAQ